MFILTKKNKDGTYDVYDSIVRQSEMVDVSKIKKALLLNIKILGASVRDGKLRLLDNVSYYNKLVMLGVGDNYELSIDNLIELSRVDVSAEHIKVDNRVNLISHAIFTRNKHIKKLSGGSGLIETNFLFKNCESAYLDLTDLDISNVCDTSYMFSTCINLTRLDLGNFNTSSVQKMEGMFFNCTSLEVININKGSFKTRNVTSMCNMFRDCRSLSSKYLNPICLNFDTRNVADMGAMFCNCSKIAYLDLSNFYTPLLENTCEMFNLCENLVKVDISNFDTSNIKYMDRMFCSCESLEELDLSNFDTSYVVDMDSMFFGCVKLRKLNFRGLVETEKMESMFKLCTSLSDLDLGDFDLSSVKYLFSFFDRNMPLKKLKVKCSDSDTIDTLKRFYNDIEILEV